MSNADWSSAPPVKAMTHRDAETKARDLITVSRADLEWCIKEVYSSSVCSYRRGDGIGKKLKAMLRASEGKDQ
jgi:hypothetical protein